MKNFSSSKSTEIIEISNSTSLDQSITCNEEVQKSEGGLCTKGYFKKIDCEMPIITVVTVVFNGVMFLEETIKSVLSQDYANIEYIIIDGGSNDGTLDIILKYEHVIDYWSSERDYGIYDAMNKALRRASGTWINLMNAGDCFASKNVLSNFKKNDPKIDIYYSDTIFVNGDKFSLSKADVRTKKFIHQSMIYKITLHERFGYYLSMPGVTISDYLFFSNAWNSGNSRWIDNPIARYRIDGVSSNRSHFYQKLAVDLICGFRSPRLSGLLILIYPIYKMLKTFFKKNG